VLRLRDARSGQLTQVRAVRRELRVCVAGDAGGAAQLRAWFAADLIRRVAERHNLPTSVWQQPGEGAAGRELAEAAGALNIHPAQGHGEPPVPPDILVSPEEGPGGGLWARPASVALAGTGTGPLIAELTGQGADPLAFRLALLGRRYREPLELAWEGLAAAGAALARWRAQVAAWAQSPSRPMPGGHVTAALAAFDDDLDTAAALRVLESLAADSGVADGAKFEAFAYLDRLLGLDLASEVGR
jgi:hypothetical protein